VNYANVTCAVWLFLWPAPIASQLQRGIEAWNSKDYNLALNFFGACIRQDSKNSKLYVWRGITYAAMKEQDKAIGDFNIAIRLDPRNSPAFYNRANAWLEKSEYDKALKDLDRAIGIDPKNADAMFVRGDIWQYKKEWDKAIRDYGDVLSCNPKNVDAYLRRAVVWQAKENHQKAIQDYDEAIRIDSKRAEAFTGRASAWEARSEYDKAIADYDQAVRLQPKNAATFYSRGNAKYAKKDFTAAIRDYDEAIRLDPKDPMTFYSRGTASCELEQYAKGVSDLEKAVQLDPEVADYVYWLAWMVATCPDLAVRDGKRAVSLATKACELSKWKDPAHLEALAAAWAECGKLSDAIKWQKKAIEIDYADKGLKQEARDRLEFYQVFKTKVMPTRADVDLVDWSQNGGTEEYWLLGEVQYVKRGEFWVCATSQDGGLSRGGWVNKNDVITLDQAVPYFTTLLRKDPNDAFARAQRSWAFVQTRELDKAIEDIDVAVRLAPESAYFNLRGNIYKAKGDLGKAIKDYSKAIEVDPKNLVSYEYRALAYQANEELEKAIDDINKAIGLNPDDAAEAALYSNRALVNLGKGESQKALNDCNEAIRLHPRYAWAYKNRALIHETLGQYVLALSDFSRAVELAPNDLVLRGRLAWYLATCPEDKVRNGKKALEYASRNCELTQWKLTPHIVTLAAAFAEIGQFDEAVKWQKKALTDREYARSHAEMAPSLLELYEQHKPYRRR
jgi:tetratricopeptide (TPR) repeat protein